MKAFSLSILLGAFLSRTDAAEQKHIDDACSDVWGVIGCSSTVTYPDYPKPIYSKATQLQTISQLTSVLQTMVSRLIQKL